MMLMDTGINMKNVEYGKDIVELVSMQIEGYNNKMLTNLTTYVPFKSGSWRKEYEQLTENTNENLENIMNRKILLVGYFICREVN